MSSFDKLQDLIGVIHNAMLNENWREFSKFQFKEMFEVLYQLADLENISDIDYNKAVLRLEDLECSVVPIPLVMQKTNIDYKGAA